MGHPDRRLVGRGLFYVVEGDDVDSGLFGAELEAELLVEGLDEIRSRLSGGGIGILAGRRFGRVAVELRFVRSKGELKVVFACQGGVVDDGPVEDEVLEEAAEFVEVGIACHEGDAAGVGAGAHAEAGKRAAELGGGELVAAL